MSSHANISRLRHRNRNRTFPRHIQNAAPEKWMRVPDSRYETAPSGLARQDGVEARARAPALHLGKTSLVEETRVSCQAALFAFGDDQHIQRLHVGAEWTDAVLVQDLFHD